MIDHKITASLDNCIIKSLLELVKACLADEGRYIGSAILDLEIWTGISSFFTMIMSRVQNRTYEMTNETCTDDFVHFSSFGERGERLQSLESSELPWSPGTLDAWGFRRWGGQDTLITKKVNLAYEYKRSLAQLAWVGQKVTHTASR